MTTSVFITPASREESDLEASLVRRPPTLTALSFSAKKTNRFACGKARFSVASLAALAFVGAFTFVMMQRKSWNDVFHGSSQTIDSAGRTSSSGSTSNSGSDDDDHAVCRTSRKTYGIIVVVRHGEREPLIPIPAANGSSYVCGDLTPRGREQMISLGRRLADKYSELIDEVPDLRLISLNESRSIRSVQLIAEELRLPQLNAASGSSLQSEAVMLIPSMKIEKDDPRYAEFVKREKLFAAAIPQRTQEIVLHMNQQLHITLPKEFQLLNGILIADSLDIVRERGIQLPFDLNTKGNDTNSTCMLNDSQVAHVYSDSGKPCDLKNDKLLTDEVYEALVDLSTETFAKTALYRVSSEVRHVRQSSRPSLTVLSLSDVHLSGLLRLASPRTLSPGRPEFGAHIIIRFLENGRVDLLYAHQFNQTARLWHSYPTANAFPLTTYQRLDHDQQQI